MTQKYDNAIEINSVSEYITEINNLIVDQDKANFFYRGQASENWDIRPSIYRDNMLSVEHVLMKEPVRKVPGEFIGMGDTFEIMEKYQHYGMCTRLLDLTSNPLVALFFACGKSDEIVKFKNSDGEEEERKANGIVYIKSASKICRYNDPIIRLISYLTMLDLEGGRNLSEVIKILNQKGIVDDDYSEPNKFQSLIKILQDAYIVLPVINNERLSRQSGAFMLPAKFNFKADGIMLSDFIIEKSVCDLRLEFDDRFFYVSADKKEDILNELDNYAINEATLFPELEYQLRQIRKESECNKAQVASFEKYTDFSEESTPDNTMDKRSIANTVSYYVKSNYLIRQLSEIVEKQTMVVDWYKRESVVSKIRMDITRELVKNQYEKAHATDLARNIVADVTALYGGNL